MYSVQLTAKEKAHKVDGLEDQRFDFERLKVYQLALVFLDHIFDLCEGLPRELQSSVADQLRRAVLSISDNLAEGTGKRSAKDKARYFGTACDSARECLSMLNVLQRRGLLRDGEFEMLRRKGWEITSMLQGLLRSLFP